MFDLIDIDKLFLFVFYNVQSENEFLFSDVKRDLMLPWVQCSLLSDCIEPIGAQVCQIGFFDAERFFPFKLISLLSSYFRVSETFSLRFHCFYLQN